MKRDWEIKKLADVCIVERGSSPRPIEQYFTESQDGVNWIKIGDTKGVDKYIYKTKEKITKEGAEKSRFVKEGDFILSNSMSFGKPYIMKTQGYIHDGWFVLRLHNFIDAEFFYHLLSSPYVNEQFHNLASGAIVKNISGDLVKKVLLPIPPLAEQQRIVSILDNAFAAIEKAKTNAQQNLKNAKELFESYLQSVFENKGDSWVYATIGETCNLQTGGTPSTSKKEYYEGGNIKWLVSGDINQKVINDCEGRITELGMKNSNTKYLPINSVLIALNGQGKTRGTVAMLRTKATCNQSLVSIYPKDEKALMPELVFSNLEGRYDEIRKMTGDSGNDRRGLNMPLIRSIKFSYPKKITEQKEIVKKLDALNSETKKLESIYQQKINDLEELKKSILQKAFSGVL
jgi:type I restriction enzyme S subunit